MRIILTTFVVSLVWAASSALAASPQGFAPAMDTAVGGVAAKGFAGEIGVTDQTDVLYDRAVSAPGRLHKPGEIWRWASVTKQLTATLVMQEVAAGRLALDDTLATRLPAFTGPSADRITLRMLLQHTSGLPNPDDTPAADAKSFPAFYLRKGAKIGGPADALGYCAGKKAEPGAGFAYNNCDYIVLGAVLEHETGKSFARLLDERIVRPLHLKTAALAVGSAPIPAMARGYVDATMPEPTFELAAFGAAGAVYGDAADLMAVDRALMTNALLPETATAIAWTGDPKLGYVALGAWSFPAPLKGCTGAVALIERRGEIGGVEVRNLIAPKLGRALVVFSDRSDLDFGEIWQGKGLTYDLASAAFCPTP